MTCAYCGETKPPSEFSHSKRRCRKCDVARVAAWRRKNKHKVAAWAKTEKAVRSERARRLKRVYGITLDEYNSMKEQQEGACAICGNPEGSPSGRSDRPSELAVDHCHKTGAVRGLLCRKCNTALGNIEDHLPAVIDYLGAHRVVSR